jgi:hypothetical protein
MPEGHEDPRLAESLQNVVVTHYAVGPRTAARSEKKVQASWAAEARRELPPRLLHAVNIFI